jgi:hypothetical protein
MTVVTFDELLNATVSDLPLKAIVDAHFDGTKCMHDFSCEVMVPLLKTLLSPSPQEVAVMDTYYKMSLLLRSALVMNTLDHFQSVASLTRSLFELWLDLLAIDVVLLLHSRSTNFIALKKLVPAFR